MSAQSSIAAWEQSLGAVLDLGAQLDPGQWQLPTECPEWTVKDVYAHLVGVEGWVNAGRPVLPDLDAFANGPVRERRDLDGPTVLAQLRDEYERRRSTLRAHTPDPDEAALSPFGTPTTVGFLLRLRALDVWIHEQDVRRAVGRPGNLDSAAAGLAAVVMRRSLPHTVAERAAAPPGTRVRVSVTGPVAFEEWVAVDDTGRGALVAPQPDATVHLCAQWEAYARLAAGRITPEQAAVRISGDHDLAGRILAAAAITP
jgi:uncharacterized protein (TIGR03083 family)